MTSAARVRVWASVVVAVALAACAAPQADRPSDDLAGLRSKLEAEFKADRFAGSVLLARLENGTPRVLFLGAFGLADREKRIANREDTRFRIGSMNKMFTATAILQLVQAGKLALTDTVGRHIPDYPNQAIAQKVTIHQLLIVIERVSGRSYYDYVSEHVYRPAGVTRSGLPPEEIAADVRAVGYSRRDGAARWTATSIVDNRGIAAGGGYSTVGDLLNFAAALMSNKLLDAEHTRLLIAGKVDSGRGPQYAYGFMDARKEGVGWVGHGGAAASNISAFMHEQVMKR